MSGKGKTPGQAACEAFWAAVKAGPREQEPDAAWNWASEMNVHDAWEAAAAAGAAELAARLDAACEQSAVARERLRNLTAKQPPEFAAAMAALLADRNQLREALRRIALGQDKDPSVAADKALMVSREHREQREPVIEPQPSPALTGAQAAGRPAERHAAMPPGRGLTIPTDDPWEAIAILAAQLNAVTAERDDLILGLRDQLAALRERLALLAANLEASAEASAPSRKSEIEQGIAAKVRALLAMHGQEPAIVTAGTQHLAAELAEREDR